MEKGANVLVVYTAMIPTARLVMDMMQRMARLTGGGLRGKKSISIRSRDIAWADVVLFVRGADPYMEKLGKCAWEAGRYCVMYLDDDLLNVPSEGIETYKDALKGCLYWCHLLWSSNPNILKKYSMYMQKPKCVEEKVFEPIETMLPVNGDTGRIRIVYAGSPSHAGNLQQYIVPALNHISNQYKNVDITFIGLGEKDFQNVEFNAEYVPWFCNFKKYRKYVEQNRYHIGLAVVEDSEFYRCKFYNKFLEYCKMGVLGIYSDCEPYRFIVRDHENGLLSANTPEDWERTLEEAVGNHEMRKSCVEHAQKLIYTEFDVNKVLDQLLRKIPEMKAYRADHGIQIRYQTERLYIRMLNAVGRTRFGYWVWKTVLRLWHFIKGQKEKGD